jgi:hypothetical protein
MALLLVAGIDDVNALTGFLLEKITRIGLNGSARGQQSGQVIWPWTATIATPVTKPWGRSAHFRHHPDRRDRHL